MPDSSKCLGFFGLPFGGPFFLSIIDLIILPDNLSKISSLTDSEVHVWSSSLDISDAYLDVFRRVLSEDELERANRFHFEKDRKHFVASRGILRFLLGAYAEIPPAQIRFVYGDKGKPFLSGTPSHLRFNVSHSHGRALWGFTKHRRFGIDLEYTQREVDIDAVAQRFFSAKEWHAMKGLPFEERKTCFFNCWTRKEAFVKALGDGLTFGLDAFDVTVFQEAEITRIDGPESPESWTLQALNMPVGYAGATAFEGEAHVNMWDLFTE